MSPPWTNDSILARYRFTNVFRALDRVSQYLIGAVIAQGSQIPDEVVFRILLYKTFNSIATWERLAVEFGVPALGTFDPDRAARLLTAARSDGHPIYSNAYIMAPVGAAGEQKHVGHLRLITDLGTSGFVRRVQSAACLEELYHLMQTVRGFGPFLSYQLAIDLNYSDVVDFDEDEFVVAGPGAFDGLAKAIPGVDRQRAAGVIRELTRDQEEWFTSFDLPAVTLYGRRIHLIDMQNLFCEIGKYARVAFPEVRGPLGRARIKQPFQPRGPLTRPVLPASWQRSFAGVGGPNVGPVTRPDCVHADGV